VLLFAGLLAAVLYAWQMAGAWVEDQSQPGQFDLQSGTRGFFVGSGPGTIVLAGKGVATGALATLRYTGRSALALLSLQDMPVLDTPGVYQLWCVDAAGTVDASSAFTIPVDDVAPQMIGISAPRTLAAYKRFFVTIEPGLGSQSPSDRVVLSN
jgi:hypothetical protein